MEGKRAFLGISIISHWKDKARLFDSKVSQQKKKSDRHKTFWRLCRNTGSVTANASHTPEPDDDTINVFIGHHLQIYNL